MTLPGHVSSLYGDIIRFSIKNDNGLVRWKALITVETISKSVNYSDQNTV